MAERVNSADLGFEKEIFKENEKLCESQNNRSKR